MKLFSPQYYKKFACIADRCRHSCCVGWEISVDSETLGKYKHDGREDILENISETDDGAEIILRDDGRCPFLDERGLCRIISECSDSYTSEICREHPRFYHRVGDVSEVGLGAVCEEAARLILSEEDFSSFDFLGEYEKCAADETDFDTLFYREEIFDLLSEKNLSYREKITNLSEKFGVSDVLSGDFSDAFSELELLEEENCELLAVGSVENRPEVQTFGERFLAYLVFRHVSVAESYENLRARVGFCLLLLKIFENATAKMADATLDTIADVARRISSEIEYSEDNTSALIFEFESSI